MVIELTAKEILAKAEESESDFTFKTKLQVIDLTESITRKGDPYLIITLGDITQKIYNVKQWIEDEAELTLQRLKLNIGNILEIEGKFDKQYGNATIVSSRLLTQKEINLENFLPPNPIDKEVLLGVLNETIKNIRNSHLKKLLEDIFADVDIKEKYVEVPSSIIHHHPYKYGNLEHTIGMIKIFQQLENYYNQDTNLDINLIYTGIIVHDIGKLLVYGLNNGIPKIIRGSDLLGHLVLGTQLVSRYMNRIKDFPKDLKNKIRHLILSHHGKKEWGSVVKPQFPEAEILHYLDMIDSRFKSTQ